MNKNTLAGIFAILFWSTNVAFSRSLAEQLGVLTAGTIMFLLGGLLSLAYQWRKEGGLGFLRHSSRKYLLGCGTIFVANVVSLELAIGLATSRTQTIIVGLINYLWPALSLALAPVFLKKKVRPFLAVGMALALGGMYLASTQGEVLNPGEVLSQPGTLVAYSLALIAAVTWGLYSNLSKKWAGDQDSGSVPLFLLVSGILMGLFRLFIPEVSVPGPAAPFEMAYMVIFPTILAYIFWDAAMRKGQMILVVSLSYFIPLFSTVTSSIRLGVAPGPELWLAAGMIIAGALVCKAAVAE
jgi:drug/metabolite transporter (DMT)-like permease